MVEFPAPADVILRAGTMACGASGWVVRAHSPWLSACWARGCQAPCRLAFEPMPSGPSPVLGDLSQVSAKQCFLLKLFSQKD